jgi:hypothetical protein
MGACEEVLGLLQRLEGQKLNCLDSGFRRNDGV